MNFTKSWAFSHPVAKRVHDSFFENDGIKHNYVTLSEGPLVVLIHGIPEFWYSWRYQIEALSTKYKVVAIDQRGFNKSSRPASTDGYRVQHLVEDVEAVICHFGQKQAVIVGHDAGAWVAWHFAAAHPEMADSLIVLSVPHPNAFREELSQNPVQHRASEYARKMQTPDAHPLFRVGPIGVLRDLIAAPLYLEAELGTDPQAILAFYQLNYPRAPYALDESLKPIEAQTLVIHGKKDQYLLASGHARNVRWLKHEPQTVMLDAEHFVHQEKPDEVNQIILDWLK
jgi:pimeloyl-ACP methyl ester carboxylesterase